MGEVTGDSALDRDAGRDAAFNGIPLGLTGGVSGQQGGWLPNGREGALLRRRRGIVVICAFLIGICLEKRDQTPQRSN